MVGAVVAIGFLLVVPAVADALLDAGISAPRAGQEASRPSGPDSAGQLASAADLTRRFSELDYRLEEVRDGAGEVPRLILATFPDDFTEILSVLERKTLFIQTLLPLLLQENEYILQEREKLVQIAVSGPIRRTAADQRWLDDLAGRYEVKSGSIEELLRRVDVVPLSLALAQAAQESGWGTSRFAREGNAVFGQWTFEETSGLVPEGRAEGETHLVRAFDGLPSSVAGYVQNLNTHNAYVAFRNRRAYMRQREMVLEPYSLANTLLYYSVRRDGYVADIRSIMAENDLTDYDSARLRVGRGAVRILEY